MYSQQQINWKALLDSVDDMFPVKPISTPQPAPITDFAEIETPRPFTDTS